MKILLIQLARLGDIYTSWPTVRALRRHWPQAEIDILVRSRFAGACAGLNEVNRVIELDSREILAGIESGEYGDPVMKARRFLSGLKQHRYDRVINLSFSPLSSYIAFAVDASEEVRGYSRFADGSLCIADAESSFFYAQVGIGRDNRAHLADIFAGVADVDLVEEDWRSPPTVDGRALLARKTGDCGFGRYIVVHVAASENHKAYEPHQWANAIKVIGAGFTGRVVLVGAAGESAAAEKIMLSGDSEGVINLVGHTTLSELTSLIGKADLVVGADSAPMHIATLTKTPCLNLSFSSVNFWETGPRAPGSRVLWAESVHDLASDKVAHEALAMLNGGGAADKYIDVRPGLPSYRLHGYPQQDFSWRLIEALYLGAPFPALESERQESAVLRLFEVNELAIEQLKVIETDHHNLLASKLLDRVDEVIQAILKLAPTLGPLIRWYQCEKTCIGPGDIEELLRASRRVHVKLKEILSVYVDCVSTAEDQGGVYANG